MTQAVALAVVQEALAAAYPGQQFQLLAQVHHIRPDGVAFVEVLGCEDQMRRRELRALATSLLGDLGIKVELIGNHDVFLVEPDSSDTAAVAAMRAQLMSARGD